MRKETMNTLKSLLAERLASKSKLTEKDVEEFSQKIKRLAGKRFLG